MSETDNSSGNNSSNVIPVAIGAAAGGAVFHSFAAKPLAAKATAAGASKMLVGFATAAKIFAARVIARAIYTAGQLTWQQVAVIAGTTAAAVIGTKLLIGAFRKTKNVVTRAYNGAHTRYDTHLQNSANRRTRTQNRAALRNAGRPAPAGAGA